MTKCDGCGKEVGKLYCGKCKQEIIAEARKITEKKGLIPLLYFDPNKKLYVFGCTVKGCPCNVDGLCSTKHVIFPKPLLHEFDGDNIVQQVCG